MFLKSCLPTHFLCSPFFSLSEKSLFYHQERTHQSQSYPLRLGSVLEAKEETSSPRNCQQKSDQQKKKLKTYPFNGCHRTIVLRFLEVHVSLKRKKKKNSEQILNTKIWRPNLATRRTEDKRRWQPRGFEYAGLFFSSA